MTVETGGNRPHIDTRCRWETGHTMTLDTGGNRTHNDNRDRGNRPHNNTRGRWKQATQSH